MLRDKNVLLLEKEDRFGGRVLSEDVFETSNNIGTQFFSEGDSSFVNLVNELGIERVSHSPKSVPYAFYINGRFYPNMKSFMNMGIKFDQLKLFARVIPRIMDFLKPHDHPKWKKLVGQNILSLEKGLRKDTKALVKTYMRGTCLAKPEHTSAGIGSVDMVGVFAMGELAYVKGGFQKITDAMLEVIDDNNPNNPLVCNFIISKYPDELEEIEQLLSLTDEAIIQQTLTDFKRIIPLADKADDYIVDTKVTRYPLGEIELSPKYYTECLPHLSKPVGNILFAGDYTHHLSFVEGAVYSAFEAARALDSRFVVSKEEEYYIKLPSLKRLFGSKKKVHKIKKEVEK